MSLLYRSYSSALESGDMNTHLAPNRPYMIFVGNPRCQKGVVSAGINATHFGASCPQHCNINVKFFCDGIPQVLIQGPTNEDCLFLSIWAPVNPRRTRDNSTSNSTGLPVLFSVARWWLETWWKFQSLFSAIPGEPSLNFPCLECGR